MPSKDNLLKGNPDTQFKASDRRAVECAKKSGSARRRNKSMSGILKILLATPLQPGQSVDIGRIESLSECVGANVTAEEAIVLAIMQQAMNGDVKAFQAIASYIGEQKKNDLEIEKLKMENEKLRIQLELINEQISGTVSSGVYIVDDIPEGVEVINDSDEEEDEAE